MRILVTGGTGFIGRAMVQRLMAGGDEVTVSTRSPSSSLPPAVRVVGPLASLVQQPSPVQGFDALIHLIGIISEVGSQTFESVHVDGTRMALRVAELAGIPRFLHMSALGTRENARSRYHQSKWRAEEYVRSSSTAWTLFRPSIVYGREDQFVNLFARISRQSPFVPVIGKGANKFQPISVDEVSHCFVAALKNPASISRTYDLCGIDAIDFRGLLGTILRVTGRHRKLVSLPLPAAR
ncbi:MAG TPA: complex I NDUFA9 subunit family protein, partial [Candidatus Limnocylindria bacterium]|nr:complex I NDUFA9 subunit family protein [Candidatus Limnocylindria bacterium]